MQIDAPSPLLGGLSPAAFMRRHWQRRPLLVRAALPQVQPPLTRSALFALAAQDGVESRLVERRGAADWRLRRGPLPRRALPPLSQPAWTLLVQGVDGFSDAARALLDRFRFVPDARLDDLMSSWASDGGGVGPHVDSYDVFLLQVQGRRQWRWAPPDGERLVEGAPLKLLARFEPIEEALLEPGDLLYLPPGWGHDGVGVGADCMTCSIGFRAPRRDEVASELLQRLAEEIGDDIVAAAAGEAPPSALYRDPRQPALDTPARVPPTLAAFALDALRRRLGDVAALQRALGGWLSEPKPDVWFDAASASAVLGERDGVVLDRRTRMLYDDRHLFINGEAFRAGDRDFRLLRELADRRRLPAPALAQLGADARAELDAWLSAGWLHGDAADVAAARPPRA